jgi:putative membrane protein
MEARHNYDKLSKLNGPKFDQEYVKISEDSHKKAMDTFQKASNEVKTPDLKDYAQSTLPTLKKNGQELSQLKNTTKRETKGTMQMKGTMPEEQNPSEQ